MEKRKLYLPVGEGLAAYTFHYSLQFMYATPLHTRSPFTPGLFRDMAPCLLASMNLQVTMHSL